MRGAAASFFWLGLTQPERDMGWLHCLLHHCQHLLSQRVQVHLAPEGCVEVLKRLCRVVLAAIEAAVNECLDTLAHRLEEGRDGQRGEDNGDAVILVDDAPQERL